MVLEEPHEGFFVLFIVVVAEDVEDAVDYEEGGFPLDEVTGVGRLVGGPGGSRLPRRPGLGVRWVVWGKAGWFPNRPYGRRGPVGRLTVYGGKDSGLV